MSVEQNTFPSGSVPSLNPLIASLELKAHWEPLRLTPPPQGDGYTERLNNWRQPPPTVQAKLEEVVVKAASQHYIAIGLL